MIKDMASHGVGVLNSLEELKELTEGIAIIRSHGVPKSICDLLEERGITIWMQPARL